MNNISPKVSSSKIYCFAPAGHLQDISSGVRSFAWLESQGYEILNHPAASRQHQRFAGKDDIRAAEINQLESEVSLHGPLIAMALRGGYGVSRILPDINWKSLASAVDKGLMLVGHSDLTALEIGLFTQTGAHSFSGPMFSADFGLENPADISKFTFDSFLKVTQEHVLDVKVKVLQSLLQFDLHLPKTVLWGGNLSMLTSMLGTPYFPSMEQIHGGTLFIEDVNEHPYRVERMLLQLAYAGVLSKQRAILVGDFSAYRLGSNDHQYDLTTAIARVNDELRRMQADTQILWGLPFGHIQHKVTLPVGLPVSLRASKEGFELSASW